MHGRGWVGLADLFDLLALGAEDDIVVAESLGALKFVGFEHAESAVLNAYLVGGAVAAIDEGGVLDGAEGLVEGFSLQNGGIECLKLRRS